MWLCKSWHDVLYPEETRNIHHRENACDKTWLWRHSLHLPPNLQLPASTSHHRLSPLALCSEQKKRYAWTAKSKKNCITLGQADVRQTRAVLRGLKVKTPCVPMSHLPRATLRPRPDAHIITLATDLIITRSKWHDSVRLCVPCRCHYEVGEAVIVFETIVLWGSNEDWRAHKGVALCLLRNTWEYKEEEEIEAFLSCKCSDAVFKTRFPTFTNASK